jgi:hypothetical protein
MACMCGDSECPSCGSAQGTKQAKRCTHCGAVIPNRMRVLTCQRCRAGQAKGTVPKGIGRKARPSDTEDTSHGD